MKTIKTILIFVCITFLTGIASTYILDYTYASISNSDIHCNIVITDYNEYTSSGNIIDTSVIWYPSTTQSGVVEILNDFGKVEIENLGVKLENINKIEAKDDFMNHFFLTVDRLKSGIAGFSTFEQLLPRVSLKELSNSCHNLTNIIQCYKGDIEYLHYKLEMDNDAPSSLMNISAKLLFTIGTVSYDDVDDDDDDDDDDNNNTYKSIGAGADTKHWAHDCIKTLLRHGVIQGYPDGSIQAEKNITRAEAAVLITNALDIEPDIASGYQYSDRSHSWYRGHVISGTKSNVIEGYLDNTFKPKRFITREEMTAMLIRGFNKKINNDKGLSFNDREKIALWAKDYIKAAVDNNVIEGYPDKTFRPKRYITRGEAFTIICKLMGLHHLHEI